MTIFSLLSDLSDIGITKFVCPDHRRSHFKFTLSKTDAEF